MAKKTESNNEFFESIKSGLTAAIEHAEGTRKDLRTTTLPGPPKELSAGEIANFPRTAQLPQGFLMLSLPIKKAD